MSEKPKAFEIVEGSTENTQRVVFEDFDGDSFIWSLCSEDGHDDNGRAPKRAPDVDFHDENGRAPKRASEILCDNHDDDGRAPKRASGILCDNKLNRSIHPTTKDTLRSGFSCHC